MNFKYDIPYAQKGQMTLEINMFSSGFYPINFSKDKSRLIRKMEDFQDSICDREDTAQHIQYRIKDKNGIIIFTKQYQQKEKGNNKKA